MLVIFAIITIFSLVSATHEKVEFDCPFRRHNGKPCLRDRLQDTITHSFLWDDILMERNMRPDLDFRNLTPSEEISEQRCCYEFECLEDCGLYHKVFYNSDSESLPEVGYRLIRKYPKFFNDHSRRLLDRYSHQTELQKEHWHIILAHFREVQKQWMDARKTVKSMSKIFM